MQFDVTVTRLLRMKNERSPPGIQANNRINLVSSEIRVTGLYVFAADKCARLAPKKTHA